MKHSAVLSIWLKEREIAWTEVLFVPRASKGRNCTFFASPSQGLWGPRPEVCDLKGGGGKKKGEGTALSAVRYAREEGDLNSPGRTP